MESHSHIVHSSCAHGVLGVFFQVIVHGQFEVAILFCHIDQADRMICLPLGCGCTLRIGIQIQTKGNASSITALDILQEVVIILAGHVLTVAAADNRKLNTGIFDIGPVNGALVLTDIDTQCNFFTGVKCIQSGGFFRVLDDAHELGCIDQLAVFKTPAVFVLGVCLGLSGVGHGHTAETHAGSQEQC